MNNNFKFDDVLAKMVKSDLANGLVPMLIGEPGIGKSSWVEALARDIGTKSFTLACNQLADKSDLTGARSRKVTKTINGTKVDRYVQAFYPHVVIGKAIDYAEAHPDETPILFLDELNRTTPDVTSEALSIPTLRSIGDQKLPDNLKIIAAGNDKGNVNSLDTASISRFVLYHVSADINTFFDVNTGLNQDVKAVLVKHPDYIFEIPKPVQETVRDDDPDDDEDDDDAAAKQSQFLDLLGADTQLNQITTPRTITALSKWLNAYDDDNLRTLLNSTYTNEQGELQSVLLDAIEAHSGQTSFSTAVCEQINQRLSQPAAANASGSSLTKPREFSKLQNADSMTAIDSVLQGLTNNTKEIERLLTYALYDKSNNAQIIDELVKVMPEKMSDGSVQKIFMLASSHSLNQDNARYLCTLDAPVVNNSLGSLRSFLD